MLERYFAKAQTLARIRGSWLAAPIESYVEWLAGRGYARSSVGRRVPLLLHFAEFAREGGAGTLAELPEFVDGFVKHWSRTSSDRGGTAPDGRWAAQAARVPVEQMLRLHVPGFSRPQPRPLPFSETAPRFFDYLREERGLREASIALYGHNLRCFETYLAAIGLNDLSGLSPAVLSGFTIESAKTHGKGAMGSLCSHVRVLLIYLHRQGTVSRDLSASVDRPRMYRLSSVPRAISWEELQQVLECIDRESSTGKRDFAMILLLATYGLRAREVAALTLDSIDWPGERLHVPDRKCGHSTAYPLSPAVGEAVVEYLRHARKPSSERALFLCGTPPFRPVSFALVGNRCGHWLRRAGIKVPRAGSHTMRHSCVSRLLEAGFPLKLIGDYIGHSDPKSTAVYAKIDIEALREVALSGCGEDVL